MCIAIKARCIGPVLFKSLKVQSASKAVNVECLKQNWPPSPPLSILSVASWEPCLEAQSYACFWYKIAQKSWLTKMRNLAKICLVLLAILLSQTIARPSREGMIYSDYGKPVVSKMDEFPENFRTTFDPLPTQPIFGKYIAIFSANRLHQH